MDESGEGRLILLGWFPPAVGVAGLARVLDQDQINEVFRQWDDLGRPHFEDIVIQWERRGDVVTLTVKTDGHRGGDQR